LHLALSDEVMEKRDFGYWAHLGSQATSALAPLLVEKRTSVGQALNEYTP